MNLKRWIFSFILIIILAGSLVGQVTPVEAVTVTGNVFLQGTYAEIGIGPNGTFGSIVDAPAGFHPHSNNANHLGFVADYQKDGWTVGTPPFGGDYFTPGSPWEGFGLQCVYGLATYSAQNYGGSATGDITPVSLTETSSGSQLSADWVGTVDICGSTLQVTHHYYMDPSWTYIKVDTTITNDIHGSTVPSLAFGRGVDPDNDVTWPGGNYTTTNTVVNQPGSIPDASDTKAIVTAYGTTYTDMGLILGTDDARARATADIGPFEIDINSTLSSPVVGPVTNDVTIQIAFNLGDLAAGNSVHMTYFYGFNAPDVGIPGPGPTPAPACSGSQTTLTGGSSTDGPWTLTVPATSAPVGSCVAATVRDPGTEPVIGTGVKSLGHFSEGTVVSPDGTNLTSFNPPLTMCYHYTDADLAASGYNPINITLGTEDDGVHWQMLATNADPATKTLCAKVSHLSYFELFLPAKLPATGFAPGRVTNLPVQTTTYQQMSDIWMEIPRLAERINIVGIPFSPDGWDISWLGSDAGWLENTALPGVAGNSVLTGHVTDALGQPGPFATLNQLWYGDQVILHAWGQQYIYEVRSVKQISPDAVSSVITHKTLSWLTLVTCKGYNETSNAYNYRVAVQAVLVQVK